MLLLPSTPTSPTNSAGCGLMCRKQGPGGARGAIKGSGDKGTGTPAGHPPQAEQHRRGQGWGAPRDPCPNSALGTVLALPPRAPLRLQPTPHTGAPQGELPFLPGPRLTLSPTPRPWMFLPPAPSLRRVLRPSSPGKFCAANSTLTWGISPSAGAQEPRELESQAPGRTLESEGAGACTSSAPRAATPAAGPGPS